MQNWIVWNRTAYLYKNEFGIINLQGLIYHKQTNKPTRGSRDAELGLKYFQTIAKHLTHTGI